MSKRIENDTGDNKTHAATLMETIGTLAYSNGPAIYMIKSVTLSATVATLGGLMSGALLATTFGGAISFTLGSIGGFTMGAVWNYVSTSRKATAAVVEFPELMRFHILQNFRSEEAALSTAAGWKRWRLEAYGPNPHLAQVDWWRNFTEGSSLKRAQSMAAVYSAAAAMTTLRELQEEQILKKYREELEKDLEDE